MQSGRLPSDLEALLAKAGDEPVVERAPTKPPETPAEWVQTNLFSSPFNTVLTLVAGAVALFAVFGILRFVFFTGQWNVFKTNLDSYMIGRFPTDKAWSIWTSVYLVCLLAGLTRGRQGLAFTWTRNGAITAGLVGGFVLYVLVYLIESTLVWVLLGAGVGIIALGIAVGRVLGERLRRPLIWAWILAFPAIIVLLRVVAGVPPRLWTGYMLNLIVAFVGIFVSFPIGLFLALGRRSSFPVIRVFCVGFIELIRGVPLYTLLVAGFFVLPLLLPPGLDIPLIIRMMAMFTIFSAAYVAEIVRGGLQGVEAGQFEASRALGLPVTRMMALVILPQALRKTIPAMISHLISLFKDTSLLAAVGLTELLRGARRSSSGLGEAGNSMEALVPAAAFFFLIAFSMSRWSQRVERRLGIGER